MFSYGKFIVQANLRFFTEEIIFQVKNRQKKERKMDKKLLERIGGVVPEEILQALWNEWSPIICVDRTIRPLYPSFVKEAKYPELELTGPAEFDVRDEQWLHPKQVGDCFSLADLQAMQIRGMGFFRKYLTGKEVFGQKSVVLGLDGFLYIPCLFDNSFKVDLNWRWSITASDLLPLRGISQVST
jgi:hypothetical protein